VRLPMAPRAHRSGGNGMMNPMSLSGPEHQKVRLPVIQALKVLGWSESQLQWQPEWRVPKSPHDAAKREGNRGFSNWPVDLVVFQDEEMPNDWQNVLGIFEFKKPTLSEGVSQLEIYLAREPRARFGVWTNGTKSATVYKLPDGTFKTVRHSDLRLPTPIDDFELATTKAIDYRDLSSPSERELRQSFEALLDLVVARDSVVTRSENQLDQLCNMLLLKLESDTDGMMQPSKPVMFQLAKSEKETGEKIREEFGALVQRREEVFREEHAPQLLFDDHTIKEIVFAWSGWNMVGVGAEAVSSAFQVFRRANLKAGEGQYFTPARVVRAAVRALDIQPNDKIIDPACGTGGFLIEAFRDMASRINDDATVRTWAHRQVHGVDKDSINVKLTRAMMMVLGDGSTHIHIGDSLRQDRWTFDYPHLSPALRDGAFTVVLTNPPFGKKLRLSARECELNHYSISWAAGKGQSYKDLELGLVFLERAYRLLVPGGRVGIILPETYFFSPTYSWLEAWMESRFIVRGVVNVPMEAFQGFCRAKTNLYILEKKAASRKRGA
jgi:type I restriction-modification system DNA methylase subunit